MVVQSKMHTQEVGQACCSKEGDWFSVFLDESGVDRLAVHQSRRWVDHNTQVVFEVVDTGKL
eukprot:1198906-Amphidinium_carterae.1